MVQSSPIPRIFLLICCLTCSVIFPLVPIPSSHQVQRAPITGWREQFAWVESANLVQVLACNFGEGTCPKQGLLGMSCGFCNLWGRHVGWGAIPDTNAHNGEKL